MHAPTNGSSAPRAGYSPDRRRTVRVQIRIPLIISGVGSVQEMTETVAVNASGCMVLLESHLAYGQPLTLVNWQTGRKVPCKVAFVGRTVEGKSEIGLEFLEPSPNFWRITFPPEHPAISDRKRASNAPLRPLPSRFLR